MKQQASDRGATGGKKCQRSDREGTGRRQDGDGGARWVESICKVFSCDCTRVPATELRKPGGGVRRAGLPVPPS